METNPCVWASGWAQVLEVFHLHCSEHQRRHLGTAGLKSVQAPGRVHPSAVSVQWPRLLDYKQGGNRRVYPFLPAASLSSDRAFQSLSWVFVAALGENQRVKMTQTERSIKMKKSTNLHCGL